jgi:hypothetical protein
MCIWNHHDLANCASLLEVCDGTVHLRKRIGGMDLRLEIAAKNLADELEEILP